MGKDENKPQETQPQEDQSSQSDRPAADADLDDYLRKSEDMTKKDRRGF